MINETDQLLFRNADYVILSLCVYNYAGLNTGLMKCIYMVLDFNARPSVPSNFNPSKLPVNEGWVPMNTELDNWTDLVPLGENHPEAKRLYARVSSEFRRTMPSRDYQIKNIYRVQNLELWGKYQEYVLAFPSCLSDLIDKSSKHNF